MSVEGKWSCPICHRTERVTVWMVPCFHQFCFGCAMRCALQEHNCPVCSSQTTSIFFSVPSDNDYIVLDLPDLAKAPDEDQQEEQGVLGPGPRSQVGSFPAKVWADFFKRHPNNIKPLLPWLQEELEVLFEGQWWKASVWEGSLVGYLCQYGLDEEVLVQELQNNLQEQTRPFIRRLITATERLCGREIRQYLGQQDTCAANGEDNNPVGSPTTGTDSSAPRPRPSISWTLTTDFILATARRLAGSNVDDKASASEATLHRVLTLPSSLPIPSELEQLHEEPDKVAAAGPSAPRQGMDHSPVAPRRISKRRASSPLGPPQPCMRPSLADSPSLSISWGPTAAPCPAFSSGSGDLAVTAVTGPSSGRSRDRSSRRPWRPAKDKTPAPLNCPQPCKRPHIKRQ